jgi:hypothetical protein
MSGFHALVNAFTASSKCDHDAFLLLDNGTIFFLQKTEPNPPNSLWKTSSMQWGIIRPDEAISSRALLDLQLRPAVRYFNELVFPGAGSVSFVRQISWGMLGLRLAEEHPQKSPARVAEAIEALASWIALNKRASEYKQSPRVQGKRKLGTRKFFFSELSKRSNYVTNPFRVGTGAALIGLGFADTAGLARRFNSLTLTKTGREFAQALLRRDRANWLSEKWMSESTQIIDSAIHAILLPGHAGGETTTSEEERRFVRVGLASNSTRVLMLDKMFELSSIPGTRLVNQNLIDLVASQDQAHSKKLDAAFKFEELRDQALQLIRAIATKVKGIDVPFDALVSDQNVIDSSNSLHEACSRLEKSMSEADITQMEASQFVREQLVENKSARLRTFLSRLPGIFVFNEDRKIVSQGYLFKSELALKDDDELESPDVQDSAVDWAPTPSRLRTSFRLMQDCGWRIEN